VRSVDSVEGGAHLGTMSAKLVDRIRTAPTLQPGLRWLCSSAPSPFPHPEDAPLARATSLPAAVTAPHTPPAARLALRNSITARRHLSCRSGVGSG
jgi:hypothetical protein